MRIRSILMLLTSVVLVPGFLAAGIAVTKVRENERQAALKGLQETVRATALLVDGQVQRSIGALTALAQSQHLQTGDFSALYLQAQAIDQKPEVWTIVLDETGTQRINTWVPLGTTPPAAVAQERVTKVLATQRPLVSDLIVGPVTGELLTTVYMPAKASPIGTFVVAQAFSVDHWLKSAIQPDSRRDWIMAVIDRSGKFIWRSHRRNEYLGRDARPELVAAAASSHSGMIRHSTLEGIDAYDAFTHSEVTGWTIAVAAPVPTIESSATQAVIWLAAGVAAALGLALLAASALGRVVLGALQVASDAARSLGRGESIQPPRTPVLEVNALNDALSNAARLLGQEKNARLSVEREREKLLANEQAARGLAQEENLAKTQFLALLGHELRNPLAAIAGASSVLEKGPQDMATRHRFLEIIQRQNRHLKRIVDDLMDVSRMLSGKIVLETHPLDFGDCVGSCIESLRTTDRAAEYAWQVKTEQVWVCGDPIRLEQIVNNLVVNALQFSPLNSVISVTVTGTANDAILEVSDSGSGMDPELQARIFEPFVQGPPLAGRQSSGLGIGLSLVKQLVQLHGGEVSVRTGDAGLGSTFTVRLARIAPPPVSVPSKDASSRSFGRVLLVDDNIDSREATAHLIHSMGYEVCEAADGEDAVQLALLQIPDIVIMDLGLPNKSGYVVAAEMKSHPGLRDVPIIALSGYAPVPETTGLAAAGFESHLIKPAHYETLALAIKTHIARLPTP
jgi:signal transduction histidine kinase/ActR/RegA family two-component response regulator